MPRTTKIVTISVFPEFMRRVDKLAKEENRTRSEMWREVMRQYIAARELRRLQDFGSTKAKKTNLKEAGVQSVIDKYRAKIK